MRNWLTSLLAATMTIALPTLAYAQAAPAAPDAPAAPAAAARPVGHYNLPGKPPYLMGHYMAWYTAPWGAPNNGALDRNYPHWSHWKWSGGQAHHDPEHKLPDGQRDVASVLYPLIGVYDSGSRAVVRYHLATMHAAGVSAVSAIWYGPGSDTDRQMPLLLEEADKLGMRVAVCYEEKLNFPGYRHPKTRADIVRTTTADLTYILNTYSHNPAYLRRNDVPVIQQFNSYGADPVLGPRILTPDEWSEVFAALPGKVEYIRQNLEPYYHPPIQAAYVWWDQSDWPARFAKKAEGMRDQGRLDFFMTMVCPGFNDTGVWGWGGGPRVSKGYGLDVLKWTTDQALDGDPELVQLVTWNDFNESTCFEPTTQHGFDFVDALETWWGQRTGRPVDLADNRAPFEEYRKTCSDTERAEIPTTQPTNP